MYTTIGLVHVIYSINAVMPFVFDGGIVSKMHAADLKVDLCDN